MSAPETPAAGVSLSFMDTYVQNVAAKSGAAPAIIAAIIAFIMQMMSSCMPAPTPPAVTSGGGMLGRILLYRAIREQGIRPLSAQGQGIDDAMQAEANNVAPEDMATLLSVLGG